MKHALIALVAGGAMAIAASSALAQADPGVSAREDRISARIESGVESGQLNFRQARQLRTELRQITDLDARYQSEGLTDWQVRDLNSRLSLLGSRVNYDLNVGRDADDY